MAIELAYRDDSRLGGTPEPVLRSDLRSRLRAAFETAVHPAGPLAYALIWSAYLMHLNDVPWPVVALACQFRSTFATAFGSLTEPGTDLFPCG